MRAWLLTLLIVDRLVCSIVIGSIVVWWSQNLSHTQLKGATKRLEVIGDL
jgi:hypothetical protein